MSFLIALQLVDQSTTASIDGRDPDLTLAVRTLVSGGFRLEAVEQKPGYAVLHASRVDEFGATHRYSFALSATRAFGDAQVSAVQIAAAARDSRLVLIGTPLDGSGVPAVDWERFLNIFGGPVFSASPFEPDFCPNLVSLGRNSLPPGLSGTADDLFEAFVRVALEFILGGRVIRYGQERRFEIRPDGIALPRHDFSLLYDAKAYTEGYPVTADSMRQFRTYVEDFRRRYNAYLPRLNAFVAISGEFAQGETALGDRSRELFGECGVPLVFLRATDLAEIVEMLINRPAARASINWSRVFADPVVKPARVSRELTAIAKDGILPGA